MFTVSRVSFVCVAVCALCVSLVGVGFAEEVSVTRTGGSVLYTSNESPLESSLELAMFTKPKIITSITTNNTQESTVSSEEDAQPFVGTTPFANPVSSPRGSTKNPLWGYGASDAQRLGNTDATTDLDLDDTETNDDLQDGINQEDIPTSGVGITEPYPDAGLAHTGAVKRNAFYLLISLFGVVGLMWVMRKEEA